MELAIGSTFAGHRIDAVAGRGGMGVVYQATDLALDRPVALKLIAPALASDQVFRAREERGLMYVTMRYIHGTDLRALLGAEGRLAPGRAVAIVAQVASALEAAHERGLVHRDVKPGNVLLTPEDHVYVSDFGLTKRALSVSGLTATGQLVGTIDYVAPEHIK